MEQTKALISCGIFKDEILFLIKKNNWNVKPVFLDSTLHIDFDKLWNTLSKVLLKNSGYEKVICYGTCHPLMHKLVEQTNSARTPAQNCVELILGREKFDNELERGAFFLFEDWAKKWKNITRATFGNNPNSVKQVFLSEHKYFLAIKTPCSGNFEALANKISEEIGLPLKWITADLNNLEKQLGQFFATTNL